MIKPATAHQTHRQNQHRAAMLRVLNGSNTVHVLRDIQARLRDVPHVILCPRCSDQTPARRPSLKAWINWYRRCKICLGKGRVPIPTSELRYQKIL